MTETTSTKNEKLVENKNKKEVKDINKDLLFFVPNIDISQRQSIKSKFLIQIIIILITFTVAITVAIVLNIQNLNKIISLSNSFYNTNGTDDTIFFYLNRTDHFCSIIGDSNISLISHPLAFLIVILYMFLFWRRSCCVTCCFRRPAMPMIIPPFQKHNRLDSALVYGIIASSIITMIFDAFTKSSNSDLISTHVNDPTGIVSLLIKIVDVFIAALRYYPILIAFHSNSFIIYIVSALFVVVDFIAEIYQLGKLIFF